MCDILTCSYRKNGLCRATGTEKDIPSGCPIQATHKAAKNNKPRTVKRNPAKRGKV